MAARGGGGGAPWWNPATQSWETGPEPAPEPDPDPAPPALPITPPGPPPAAPGYDPEPEAGAEAGPGAGAGADAGPVPEYGPAPGYGPTPAYGPEAGAGPVPAYGPGYGGGYGTAPSADDSGSVPDGGGGPSGELPLRSFPSAPSGLPPLPPLPPLPSLPALPQLPPLGDTAAGYPPAPRTRSRLSNPVIAVIAVAALAGGAAAVWFVQRDGEPPARAVRTATAPPTAGSEGPATDDPQGEPTTAGPSASPSESASPSASAGAVPDGFRIAPDPKGFTLAVPKDWARSEEKAGVFFRSADGESLLQVFRVDEADMSPLDAVRGASGTLASNPGYTEVSVTEVPGEAGGPAAAELVYEYDGSTGSRRRGVERVFVTPAGQKYALLVRAPAAEWPRQQDVLAAALSAFKETP